MGEGVDFGDRNAAVQVGPDVVRLGRRGVVDVTADVAVVILGFYLVERNNVSFR